MIYFATDEIAFLAQQAIDEYGSPRCSFIRGAMDLVDLAYADPNTRDRYVEELHFWGIKGIDDGSHENYTPTDQQRSGAYSMGATQSSCGITTRRVWRYAGVNMPAIYDYYGNPNRIGTTVTAEMQFAKENGAWTSAIPWVEGTAFPLPGDACIIGCTSCAGVWARNSFNGEHEYNIVAVDPDEQVQYSLDGGQPGIHYRTRKVLEVWTGENSEGQRTGELWAGAVDPKSGECAVDGNGRPYTGRRFIGFSRAADLPLIGDGGDCGMSTGAEVAKVAKKGAKIAAAGAGVLLLGLAGRAVVKAWVKAGSPGQIRL